MSEDCGGMLSHCISFEPVYLTTSREKERQNVVAPEVHQVHHFKGYRRTAINFPHPEKHHSQRGGLPVNQSQILFLIC